MAKSELCVCHTRGGGGGVGSSEECVSYVHAAKNNKQTMGACCVHLTTLSKCTRLQS